MVGSNLEMFYAYLSCDRNHFKSVSTFQIWAQPMYMKSVPKMEIKQTMELITDYIESGKNSLMIIISGKMGVLSLTCC